MKTILLLHGPNLNRLGARAVEHYGTITLADLEALVTKEATTLGYALKTFQSNHEGALIDWLQAEAPPAAGVIINPGALTHTSYALHDALFDTGLPCIEVHLSDIHSREPWRAISVIAPACVEQITGKKEAGYAEAVRLLHHHITKK